MIAGMGGQISVGAAVGSLVGDKEGGADGSTVGATDGHISPDGQISLTGGLQR